MVEEQDRSHKYVKPLDVLDGKSGHLQLCFFFLENLVGSPHKFVASKAGVFTPNLILSKPFLCPNLTRPSAKRSQNIKLNIEPKEVATQRNAKL